ncbi:MAG TPA: hypothetical protein VFR70_04095 [Flavobacterium sp.]|nr:hypothetical protein [Flavobacterium sp.]
MKELWNYYLSKSWVEPFLVSSIVLFAAASIILYMLIIKSRAYNLKREGLSAKYNIIIEKVLFAVIFKDTAFAEIKRDTGCKLLSNKVFKNQMISSILNLHQNYEGAYAEKLEKFYAESGLIKKSFKKLRSKKWEVVCSGVKELAEMNVTEAFEKIIKISKTRNKTLKVIALNAGIKLNGAKGLLHLVAHQYPLDEWTQVNIIASIKLFEVEDTHGIEMLLESKNSTVVVLGLKIIKTLGLSAKADYVARLAASEANYNIRMEAQNVLNSLNI